MGKKMISSEKNLTKLDALLIREECSAKEDVKVASSSSHQHTKVRRRVKLPRLKLECLVVQVTEENAHKEISTGPAVGNEIW